MAFSLASVKSKGGRGAWRRIACMDSTTFAVKSEKHPPKDDLRRPLGVAGAILMDGGWQINKQLTSITKMGVN